MVGVSGVSGVGGVGRRTPYWTLADGDGDGVDVNRKVPTARLKRRTFSDLHISSIEVDPDGNGHPQSLAILMSG